MLGRSLEIGDWSSIPTKIFEYLAKKTVPRSSVIVISSVQGQDHLVLASYRSSLFKMSSLAKRTMYGKGTEEVLIHRPGSVIVIRTFTASTPLADAIVIPNDRSQNSTETHCRSKILDSSRLCHHGNRHAKDKGEGNDDPCSTHWRSNTIQGEDWQRCQCKCQGRRNDAKDSRDSSVRIVVYWFLFHLVCIRVEYVDILLGSGEKLSIKPRDQPLIHKP